MTYFELFEIPVSLRVDPSKLSKTYFKLSRQFHPDFHTHASAEEQEKALEITSLLNEAWKTFQNPSATLRYALTVKGLLDKEEKHSLSPDFLMDMMEINEALSEEDAGKDPSLLLAKIQELENAIYDPVKKIIEHYDDLTATQEELAKVKEYYFQQKYLNRIRTRIHP